MNPKISQQTDGWYVRSGTAESVIPNTEGDVFMSDVGAPGPLTQDNSLGLDLAYYGAAPSNPPAVTYYAAAPSHSGHVQALMDDMRSNSQASERPSVSSIVHTPLATSPKFRLRPLAPLRASSRARPLPLLNHSNTGMFAPPPSSAPPQLPPQLPVFAPDIAVGTRSVHELHWKRKRLRTVSPTHSDEGGSDGDDEVDWGRPKMLLAPPAILSSTNGPSATQRLAAPRSVSRESDRNADAIREGSMDMGDDQVVQSLYEESSVGDVVDLRKLCGLLSELLRNQAHLTGSIRQIDARTQQLTASNAPRPTRPSEAGGTYVSPPSPPSPINWDQSAAYNEPAGRKRRAKRRVLLMSLIRETIFKMLSRLSVHDPLPPPPPPALWVPTLLNFAIRWHESSKSVFNQVAASLVTQKIVAENSEMLEPEEVDELPSMVSKHLKYLCRCYKDQNREDAEDFNASRLKRCGVGTRKRQLLENRLQVLDKFPEHLGKHRHLIAHLGVDGTSSDEEEVKGSGIYKIKSKPQLSSKVTLLKRDLDFVYQLYFKGPGTKGSQVHKRVPSDLISTRPFLIQGLPLSCVSRAWYQDLDPAEREFYRFIPHNYDYSFPAGLLNPRASGWPLGERSRDVSP